MTPNYAMTDAGPRTRRPIGHRVEDDGPDPDTEVQTWLYREDAQAVASSMDGYLARVQYVGAWMRWTVLAKRKSWTHERWLNRDGQLGERW